MDETTDVINTEEPIGGNAVENDTNEADQMRGDLQVALQNALGKKEETKEIVEDNVSEEQEPIEEIKEEVKPEEGTKESDDEEFPKIPTDWSKEERERFETALDDPALKEQAAVFIERYNHLKKGFYKKAEETAELKKSVSAWNDIFDANAKAALEKRGIDEVQYTRNLMNVDRLLSQDPAGTLKRLMEGYKVTPEQLGFSATKESTEDYYNTDDEINQLRNEIKELLRS